MFMKKPVTVISIIFVLSVFFASCKFSVKEDKKTKANKEAQTEQKNDNEEVIETKIESDNFIFESTSQGIKISWRNLDEKIKGLEIITKIGTGEQALFEINNLEEIKSVVDEYVTKEQEYKYYIITRDENENYLNRSKLFTITAQGGKGECNYTLEATDQGIHFSFPRHAEESQIEIHRTDSNNNFVLYSLNKKTGSIDFTDSFVNSNSEYKYRIQEQIGKRTTWNNGVRIPADSVVSRPRYKIKSILANAGSVEISMLTQPAAVFDDEENSITFTRLPKFSITPRFYYMNFQYQKDENSYNTFFSLSSNTTTETPMYITQTDRPGIWVFNNCYCTLKFDDFNYSYFIEDMSEIPQTMNISNVSILEFTATPTQEGIKIEWQKLPKNTKIIEIYEKSEEDTTPYEITVYDLTKVSSVVDKYVSNGKEYKYSVNALDEKGKWIYSSETITVAATGGLGKDCYSAEETSDGIQITGNKISSESGIEIRKKILGDDRNNRQIYSSQNGTTSASLDYTDCFVTSGEEYIYTIIESLGNKGQWNNGEYSGGADDIVEVRTQSIQIKAENYSIIKNHPSVTYDASKEVITFSELPQLSQNLNNWVLHFYYTDKNGRTRILLQIGPWNTSLSYPISTESDFTGDLTFAYYSVTTNQNSSYNSYRINNLGAFASFPENITVNNINKVRLSATPTNEGILFEWENAPDNIESLMMYVIPVDPLDDDWENNLDESQTLDINIRDVTISSFLFKYVDSGMAYAAAIEIGDDGDGWYYSDLVKVTATGGSGELKLTNSPVATFDNISNVTFSTLPQIPVGQDANWTIYFNYRCGNTTRSLYNWNSNDQNPKRTIRASDIESGTWVYDGFSIELHSGNYWVHREGQALPQLPQTIVISTENLFRLEATPTEQGIKLEWKNLPEGAQRIRIGSRNTYYDSFEIRDFENVTSVVDKYVDSGKEYTYHASVRDENGNDSYSQNITVKATGGSGECEFNATPVSNGIQLTAQRQSDESYLNIYKFNAKQQNHSDQNRSIFTITDDSDIDITDIWVSPGEEYDYYIVERVGGYYENGDLVCPNGYLEYPRYKTVTGSATAGSGEPKIINNPVATYNAQEQYVIFSVAPQVSSFAGLTPTYWGCRFTYSHSEWGWYYHLFTYNPKNDESNNGRQFVSRYSLGTYTLNGYYVDFTFDSFEYETCVQTDIGNLGGIPQSFTFE